MWRVDSGKAFHFVKCNHLSADRGKKVIRRRMASRQDKDTLSLHHQQYNSKEYFLSIWLHVLARAQFWISSLKNLTVYIYIYIWTSQTFQVEQLNVWRRRDGSIETVPPPCHEYVKPGGQHMLYCSHLTKPEEKSLLRLSALNTCCVLVLHNICWEGTLSVDFSLTLG